MRRGLPPSTATWRGVAVLLGECVSRATAAAATATTPITAAMAQMRLPFAITRHRRLGIARFPRI